MATVQTWADNFGNWHALVSEDYPNRAYKLAYVAIRDELKARMNPDHFGEESFGVTQVFENGAQTEWVESWEGEGIPTMSDVVTCGECGKSFPPNVAPSARCPFEYDHAPAEIAGAEDEHLSHFLPDYLDLEITYTDGFVEIIRDVRFQVNKSDPNPIQHDNGIVRIETVADELWSLLGVRKMRFLSEDLEG